MTRIFTILLFIGLAFTQHTSKDKEIELDDGTIVILHPDRTWEFKKIDIMDMGRDVLKLQNGAVYQGVYKSKDEKSVTFHVDGYKKPQTLPLSLTLNVTLRNGDVIIENSLDTGFQESTRKKNIALRPETTRETKFLTYNQANDINFYKNKKNYTKYDSYETKNGAIIELGDTLIIGSPSAGDFTYDQFTRKQTSVFSLIIRGGMGYQTLIGMDYIQATSKGNEVIVEKIWIYHSNLSSKSPLFVAITAINPKDVKIISKRTIFDIDKALLLGEIISPKSPMKREDAIKKLKEYKELLELDLINQEEYESYKNKLSPIIMNK